jgi:D-glycero-beta-D-manno-heptose 1-phosphate adenylyltransferase
MDKLEIIKSKIYTDYSSKEFSYLLAFWRFKAKKIVFTNGCFDILHRGHVEYLTKASQEGDILIVGLNSDESVSKLKGKNRPVQDIHSRTMLLAAFQFINAVVVFNENTPYNLIELIQPDILIKGGDYTIDNIVGSDIVKNRGGEVKTIPFVEGYSTSLILDKLQIKK